MPQLMVRRLPRNETGRDFLVGDIHGAYDCVIEAMRTVSFDPARDRLISVGDLIDRGKGSARVVRFLQQPYVFAVRGNHDHDFAQLDPEEIRLVATLPRFGMGWARNLSDQALLEIRDSLRELPLAIEIATSRGLVGVVHAQPPAGMTWNQFTAALEGLDEATIHCALTARERIQTGDNSTVQGVGRVYVGHTTQHQGARMYGNVVAIDTGAVLRELGVEGSNHLTMINAVAHTADIGAMVEAAMGRVVAIDSEGEGAFSSLRPAH
jgi:serine/threonine protein phosphatase 1